MTEPENPVPSLADLMKQRRELWEQAYAENTAHRDIDDGDRMMDAFFRLNFTIDELLAAQTLSNCEAQKWVAHEIGELRASLDDVKDRIGTAALEQVIKNGLGSGCG